MKILALETAADPGSVALWLDGVVVDRECPDGSANSETLIPLAEALMREHGVVFADLDGVAFGAGPGSFTGLRVACGVAQGMAFAQDVPLLGVGTLDAMALSAGGARVIVALDARMGEVYFGLFQDGQLLGELGVFPPEGVPLPVQGGWLACGNGLAAYPALRERLAAHVDVWKPEVMPNAAGVVRLAAVRFGHGERVDAADAVPMYVRDKVAKTIVERLAEGGRA